MPERTVTDMAFRWFLTLGVHATTQSARHCGARAGGEDLLHQPLAIVACADAVQVGANATAVARQAMAAHACQRVAEEERPDGLGVSSVYGEGSWKLISRPRRGIIAESDSPGSKR